MISCKFLDVKFRIFAGTCTWKIPSKEEMQVVCESVRCGEIVFGELMIKKSDIKKPTKVTEPTGE